MALLTLVGQKTAAVSRRVRMMLVVLGIFGAPLFFGDSMITPAISVLSAVEGLREAAPPLADWVVPFTIGSIIAMFLVQRFGTIFPATAPS